MGTTLPVPEYACMDVCQPLCFKGSLAEYNSSVTLSFIDDHRWSSLLLDVVVEKLKLLWFPILNGLILFGGKEVWLPQHILYLWSPIIYIRICLRIDQSESLFPDTLCSRLCYNMYIKVSFVQWNFIKLLSIYLFYFMVFFFFWLSSSIVQMLNLLSLTSIFVIFSFFIFISFYFLHFCTLCFFLYFSAWPLCPGLLPISCFLLFFPESYQFVFHLFYSPDPLSSILFCTLTAHF